MLPFALLKAFFRNRFLLVNEILLIASTAIIFSMLVILRHFKSGTFGQ